MSGCVAEGGLHVHHVYTRNVETVDICVISVPTRPAMKYEVDAFRPS